MSLKPVLPGGFVQVSTSGGGAVTDPNVAYIRSDGNDGTGDGSPSAPFLTFQAAVDAADNFTIFNFGDGSFGDGDFSARATSVVITMIGNSTIIGDITLVVIGESLTATLVGSFTEIALFDSNAATPGAAAGAITINGNAGVNINTVRANGAQGAAGDPVTPSGNGGAGGNITINGPVVVNGAVSLTGGAAGVDGGGGEGSPGAAGVLTLKQCPSIPTPNPDAATVAGAIINGVFSANTYP